MLPTPDSLSLLDPSASRLMYHIRRRMEKYGIRVDHWQHFAIRPTVNGETAQWCRRLLRDTDQRQRVIDEVNRSMRPTGWQITRSKASYTTQQGKKSRSRWLHVSLAFYPSLVTEETAEEMERRRIEEEAERTRLARIAEIEEELSRLRAM